MRYKLLMGYLLRKLKSKRGWKVQYRTSTRGKRYAKDIPENDYMRLGLHRNLDLVEVQERVKQLNSQEKLRRIQEARIAIKGRLDEDDTALNAFLPAILRAQFEKDYINNESKKVSHWRTAKRLIVEIGLPLEDWEFNKHRWYKLFQSKHYSADYVQKLLHILNLWGKFVAHKQRVFYAPISGPVGIDKQRIVDAYEYKGDTKASLPLTPEILESLKSKLPFPQYNWLFLSMWLGLRPSEVDSLHLPSGPKTWRLEDRTLWVYQTKLTGIASVDRWKPIPIKYLEQLGCVRIIKELEFKRPLNKTLIKYTDKHITCYGGRKGFVDLMLEQGISLEAISSWLGHRSLDRTWKVYKDKKKVLLK